MQSFMAKFGLPLLSRELIQLAARRRTYVIRVLYAAVLYGISLLFVSTWIGQFSPDSFEVLGQGKTLFAQIVRWQFLGIFLFLPATTCGAITSEKERGTLPLLQLTKLNVWTILLEKLASRLIEMGSYLLLSLPLAAMAYALGGVEESDIFKAVYVLGITALQVGCFSLLCSVWFQTTAGSMIAAYLLGIAAMVGGSWLLRQVLLIENPSDQPLSGLWVLGFVANSEAGYFSMSENDPQQDIEELLEFELSNVMPGWLVTSMTGRMLPLSLNDVVDRSLLMIASACICLLIAGICFRWPAETGRASFLKRLLAHLDRVTVRVNSNRITRGIAWSGTQDLPVSRPIAWYETRRRLMGRPRHLIWLLLVLEVPLIGWMAWQSQLDSAGFRYPELRVGSLLDTLRIGLSLIVLLVVVAVSTSIVPRERARQTFDVLLSTPLAGREIVLQKMAALMRLIAVLCVPLVTILLCQVSIEVGHRVLVDHLNRRTFYVQPGMLFLRRLTAIAVYLPLVGWLGFQAGLRMKNQSRAIFVCLISLSTVCGVPFLLEWLLPAVTPMNETSEIALNWINPWFVGFGGRLEWYATYWTSDIFPHDWFPFLFHFLIVGGMLWAIRRNALKDFSRIVGRLEPPVQQPFKRAPVQTPLLLFNSDENPLPENSRPRGANDRDSADAKPSLPSPGTKNE